MLLFETIMQFVPPEIIQSIMEYFFNDIIKWLKLIGEIARKKVQGTLIGCKSFIDVDENSRAVDGKEISRNYSKVGAQWQVTEVERNVSADKIPDEIYEQAAAEDNGLMELTKEIEAQLLQSAH